MSQKPKKSASSKEKKKAPTRTEHAVVPTASGQAEAATPSATTGQAGAAAPSATAGQAATPSGETGHAGAAAPSAASGQAGAAEDPAPQAESKEGVFRTILEELKAQIFGTNGYLKINYFTLFWLFVAGSMIGLGFETVYHAIVFGGWESRAGLVWGPFSPIYGVGAVVLTVFLNRFYHSHNLVIFLVSMVLGSIIEYVTSWGMEVFWGAIAWDYTGTFGSIQGRTNFFFGMMWGMLGLMWVRIMLPIVKQVFTHINAKSRVAKAITAAMTVFMAVNIVCTVLALNRESQRMDGIPATNPIQQFCDTFFPDDFLQSRFENMTVTGKQQS